LPHEILETSRIAFKRKKRDRWHESLAKDIYVEEALNVLDDLQTKVILKKASPSKIKKRKSS
jgi:carboxyl-terminal processing protease